MRKLLLLVCLTPLLLLAQGETVELEGWRWNHGDDPRWADPAFDDSTWRPSAPPVSAPGIEELPRMVWYRATFRIPDWWAGHDLAIGLWKLGDGYEVFANGVKIGQHGTPERVFSRRPLAFAIPHRLIQAGTVRLAVRRWREPGNTRLEAFDISPLRQLPPVIGLKQTVLEQQRILWLEIFTRGVPALIATLITLASGLFCLRLWRRGEGPELLWAGLATTLAAAGFVQAWPMLLTDAYPKNSMLAMCVTVSSIFGAHVFYAWFLAETVPAWRGPLRWAGVALALGSSGLLLGLWGFQPLDVWLSNIRAVSAAGATGVGIAVAFRVWRAGDAHLAGPALAVTLRGFVYVASAIDNNLNFWLAGPFIVSFRRTSDALIALALAVLLYRRARNQHAARLELERDVAAAGRMQAFLLNAGVTETPGFHVETEYLPSREVGGDFYQILPRENGSLLVLAGDVSGKGLRAAMVVSTIVGALRNRRSDAPGEVLAELNRVLQGGTGFTTCCCLLLSNDGIRIANAGHPAPYLQGVELATAAGLPLGVSPEASYEETTVSFPDHSQLTLVTDGVIEAAKASGELFGFDRTREISTRTAAEIAEAAKQWGQNDDITVVTVRRSGA